MGSTITTARVAAALRTQHGRKLFALFEESYSSNVRPHTPEWCCMGIGYLPATMERIFGLASGCEGGMLRNRSGPLTPEGYIGTWLRELANPLAMRHTDVHLGVGDYFYNAIQRAQLDQAVDFLTAAGLPAQAAALRDKGAATLDMARDTEALLALQAGLAISPWRIVSARGVSHRSGDRDPALGHKPAPGRTPTPDVPTALKLGRDVRLLRDGEGTWRCGGWQYALVGEHIRGLWRAELAGPGHHRKRISAFRDALDRAPPAPAGLMVEIDATSTVETHYLKKIKELREQAGAGPGAFQVPMTADTIYALTNLPQSCARWLLPDLHQAAPAQQVALTL